MAKEQTAVFGGGCFWCIEAIFQRLTGVTHVESGYMGGQSENPTYREVCGGDTGHVEVVRVTFNPEEISYRELLDVFFTVHDPTTLNRQGNDAGEQYRSVIFYTDEDLGSPIDLVHQQAYAAQLEREAKIWQRRNKASGKGANS